MSLEEGWNGGRLNGGGEFEAHALHGLEELWGESEITKKSGLHRVLCHGERWDATSFEDWMVGARASGGGRGSGKFG